MFWTRVSLVATCITTVLTIFACGEGGETIPTATKLTSATLARQVENTQTRSLTASGCGGSHAACITPTSITGKAYYAGMIVGASNGLSLGPILGSVLDPSTATAFSESELLEFDFSQGISNAGNVSLGGPIPYPSDDNAVIQNAHIYFGWVDTTFTLGSSDGVSGAIQDTHTIRLVYADITGTEYQKGDLLYHGSNDSTFKWCTSSGCDQASRPSSPLQVTAVANFSSTGEGNQTIPSFYAKLSDGHAVTKIFESELKDTTKTWTFTIDFVMTLGVKFSSNPTGISSVQDLVAAFALPADPGDTDDGFTSNITITDQNGNSSGQSSSARKAALK